MLDARAAAIERAPSGSGAGQQWRLPRRARERAYDVHPDAIRQGFTADWFDANIPHWNEWLSGLKGQSRLRILEVGCFEGRATVWLAQNVIGSGGGTIDCVDLFAPDPVHGDYHARFRANTAAYALLIREYAGRSFDVLRSIEGDYDLIYIDGDHTAFGVLADGVLCWPLLKIGGLMIFDDYEWMPPRRRPAADAGRLSRWIWRVWGRQRAWRRFAVETPKPGIDGLLATLEGCFEIVGKGYQIAVRKTRAFDAESQRLTQAPTW